MRKSIISVAVLTVLITNFNGCGSSSGSSSKDTRIDILQYFEKNSQLKNMLGIDQDSRKEKEEKVHYQENVKVEKKRITYSVKNTVHSIINIGKKDLNITIPEKNNHSYLIKRKLNKGDVISSYTLFSSKVENEVTIKIKEKEECIFDKQLTTLSIKSKTSATIYNGDILRQKCTTIKTETYTDKDKEVLHYLDIKYTYYQKDKGEIAGEDKNCWVKHKNRSPNNDKVYYVTKDKSKECYIRTNSQTLLLE